MAPGPETKLVAAIKAAILSKYPGSFVHKNHGSQFSVGMPDLSIVVRGTPVFLEVKCPREGESDASIMSRVTPLQQDMLRKLRGAGATADVAWSVEQALEILDRAVPLIDRVEISRDARLYSLADAEDKLRSAMEAMEGELYDLRVENDLMRKTR